MSIHFIPSAMPEGIPSFIKSLIANTAGGLMGMTNLDIISKEGTETPYQTENFNVEYFNEDFGIPIGFWRSVGHSFNAFVVESFMDECAHLAQKDPVEFRKHALKNNSEYFKVINEVIQASEWGTKKPNRYQGFSVHKSFGSVVAQVVEISLNPFKVEKVYCAIDCGLVVNPIH